MRARQGVLSYRCTLLALFLVLSHCGGAYAVSRTWRYDAPGSWDVPGNWVPDDDYPKEYDTAIIDQGVARIENPVLPGAAMDIKLGSASEKNGSLFVGGRGLNFGGTMYVGLYSRGTVTQDPYAGYGVNAGIEQGFGLLIGVEPGASGVYVLNSGELGFQNNGYAWLLVGVNGSGSMAQTGGKVCGDIVLGYGTTGVGEYDMGGGAFENDASDLIVGLEGTGTFRQTGGEAGVGFCTIGGSTGGIGVYQLMGGSIVLNDDGNLIVGTDGGTGTLEQTGGSVAGRRFYIHVGNHSGSRGSYVLTGGSCTAPYGIWIGGSGRGTFQQEGGDVVLEDPSGAGQPGYGNLAVGGLGTYKMVSGALRVVGNSIVVNDYATAGGTGRFLQTGGVTTTQYLSVGGHAPHWVWSGYGGGPGILQERGGVITVLDAMDVGTSAGGPGLVELSGGDLFAGTMSLGGSMSEGRLVQTIEDGASYCQVDGAISLGYGEGAKGSYSLSGGSFSALSVHVGGSDEDSGDGWVQISNGAFTVGELLIGESGAGEFWQDGGVVEANALTIARGWGDEEPLYPGAGGIYTLSADTATLEGNAMTVGKCGSGYFKQTAGTVRVNGALMLGEYAGSRGTYELAGGTLIAEDILAGGGDAVFLLSGGTFSPPLATFGPDLVNTGGVLEPNGSSRGTVYFASTATYTQGPQGTLVVSIRGQGFTSDSVVGLATCSLDGLLHVDCGDNRPRECTKFPIIVSGSGISGDFAEITTDLTLGLDPLCPVGPVFWDPSVVWDPSVERGIYYIRMCGLTNGDANGDHAVDGGDLALLGGNWNKSGMQWKDGDFTGDGIVDGGDLALMGGNWNWVCPDPNWHTGGEGKCGGEGAKFNDGGLDLSDRDGDGDFDVDDMLIIIQEMNDPSKQDPDARDSSASSVPDDVLFETWADDDTPEEAGLTDSYPDGGEDEETSAPDYTPPGGLPPEILPPLPPALPGDPSAPGDLPPPAARLDRTDDRLLASAMDSPVFWAACWIGSIAALLRVRRRG